MSLSLYLTKARRWLRAGYPVGAPRHGYVPLIALMPTPHRANRGSTQCR